MSFSIVAQPVLGTFRGHRPDGSVDSIPSVDRLFGALMCAAGFGPRALEKDGRLTLSEADRAALEWLENHPPSEVVVPPIRVNTVGAIAYRNDGTLGEKKAVRVLGKRTAAVAVHGSFVWTWHLDPPHDVAESLSELCSDVPSLGSSESPMVLTVTSDRPEPTHLLDPGASRFARDPGVSVSVPISGRSGELSEMFAESRRPVRDSADRAKKGERSQSPVPRRRAVRSMRFREVDPPATAVPWPTVLTVALDRVPRPNDRVATCVAAHRALIKILGRGAPTALTGVHPDGVVRPSNNVAIQLLDSSMPVGLPGGNDSALAVMIPGWVEASDLAEIVRALSTLTVLFLGRRDSGTRGPIRVIGPVEAMAGDRVWSDPDPGSVRVWRTYPAAVPDTRGRKRWTFADAALLSVGFVWQGVAFDKVDARGAARDSGLRDAVGSCGVSVLESSPLRTSTPGRFVHHVHGDAVVRPYTASLDLGTLAPVGALTAIGQSRHLGGGLLVPVDRKVGRGQPGRLS